MPYITREDGERFVIPSYRDVLSAKNKTQLKKEVLLLSQSYGEYITLQRKNVNQFEVAFSTDTGYLLGETVWHYFKSPPDLIYCEILSNTTEALLVIVKNGSVYLDGNFPLESIPEELVIFLTQENNFDIYIYGDVPISETPAEGKFSFEANSVKSFEVLTEPVFPKLPLLRIYQLQFVDIVLKSQGIGVFPLNRVLAGVALLGVLWIGYNYLTAEDEIVLPAMTTYSNPFQGYFDKLTSPAPEKEIIQFVSALNKMFGLPGWVPTTITYENSTFTAQVKSNGGTVEALMLWARHHFAKVDLRPEGVYLVININTLERLQPKKIFPIKDVMASFIDRVAIVYPGNRVNINDIVNRGKYTTVSLDVTIESGSPVLLTLISDQFRDLPFVLNKIALTMNDSNLSGLISLEALGN